jgi:NCS2 family nucleobase:cation symporter-2
MVSNGLTTIAAGAIGVLGGNTQSSSIGMSDATGVTSRWVGYWLGGLLIVFSFFPVLSAALVATPQPVMGAALLFSACFMMVGGLQIITTRLLDARRTLIVGLALVLSLSYEIFPALYRDVPGVLQPFMSSGLVIGLVAALLLNAVFRIGVRTRAMVSIEADEHAHDAVRSFLEQQGAKWGARRDVVERAIFGTAQALESIAEHCEVQGQIDIEAAFDEFNLDIRISYRGADFVLPDRRPTEEQILESEDGLRLLAGYLIQRNADGVRASRKEGHAVLEFHFQH